MLLINIRKEYYEARVAELTELSWFAALPGNCETGTSEVVESDSAV